MWMIIVDRDERRTELSPLVYAELQEEKAIEVYEQMKSFGYLHVYFVKVLRVHHEE